MISLLLVVTLQVAASDIEEYTEVMRKISSPLAEVKSVADTPIDGIKEILVDMGRGSEVMYISTDGKYLVSGSLFDIENRVDLTEAKKTEMRTEVMKQFGEGQRINFYPEKDKMKHHVTVFTDIDCGYCRKLHSEVEQYNEKGIGISYLFFPRAGLKSGSFDKAVNVWCADDQQEAMTLAKAGETVPPKQCDNPIESQYKAGIAAGVNGTPALVLDDGTMMPGYVSPDQLSQRLELIASKK